LKLMESMVTNKNLRKHMIATQACMRRLAKHFGEDEGGNQGRSHHPRGKVRLDLTYPFG